MTPVSSIPVAGTKGISSSSPVSGSDRMELIAQQADLAFAVGRALGSVSNRSPLPLLSCVLLEAGDGQLTVTGTDLDVTTSVRVPCTIAAPGRAAVSARHFNDVIRKMSRGKLSLSLKQNQFEIRYGDGKGWSRFPTQDPADFPRVPDFKAEASFTLEAEALARLVARSSHPA